jgi:phosphopantetheinyl transferase
MLLQHNRDRQGILTGIWKIEEQEETLLGFFNDKEEIIRQIASVTNPARRCEKLAVRALLNTLTGEEKTIAYLPSGKPVLTDNSFNISISHTQVYAAVALHKNKTVGIDIEIINDRVTRIKSRFLNIKEREALDKSHEPVVSLLCWSAKETVYKMLCREGVDFAQEIFIEPFGINDASLIAFEKLKKRETKFVIDFAITDQYVLTWSCE